MELKVKEVALLFNVAERVVYRWVHDDDLPYREVDGQYYFGQIELLEWATVRKIKFSPALLGDLGPPRGGETLTEALRAGGLLQVTAAGSIAEVFREVTDRLMLPASCDRGLLRQLLLAREQSGSTAVGDGVAIPHPRYPVVMAVERPVLGVCYLGTPVDFHAPDGRPVDTLFVLIATTIRVHLAMLSRIACALRDDDVMKALRRRAPVEELLRELGRVETAIDHTLNHTEEKG